jgi:non-ribosomal peptide synthetase component F
MSFITRRIFCLPLLLVHCVLCGSSRGWAQEIAIISVKQNVRWTYAKVDADSNRLARWMQNRGIGPGSNVGMFLPRSAEV